MASEPLLTTEEVASLLGVKQATVYAYVSRGLLTSRRNADGKNSLFTRSDVDAFVATRKRPTTPGIQTGITLIRDGRLFFRGQDATILARDFSYESVAALLWSGDQTPTPVNTGRPTGTVMPADTVRLARADTPGSSNRPAESGEPGETTGVTTANRPAQWGNPDQTIRLDATRGPSREAQPDESGRPSEETGRPGEEPGSREAEPQGETAAAAGPVRTAGPAGAVTLVEAVGPAGTVSQAGAVTLAATITPVEAADPAGTVTLAEAAGLAGAVGPSREWAGRPGADLLIPVNGKLWDLVVEVTAKLPATARLTDRLRVIVAAASAADPLRFDTSPAAVIATGRDLLATMVHGLPARTGVPVKPIPLAEALWHRLTRVPPTEEGLRALNGAMVLLADHDIAASTLAARVAASTRAHPYAVVSAGLAALDGPLHGAASGLAYQLLIESSGAKGPAVTLSDRLRTGVPVPGFGHPLYPDGDPRATALFDLLGDGAPKQDALRLDRTMRTRSGTAANIDLALAALSLEYDMPAEAGEVIFAVARTAGWLAHAMEEYGDRPLRFRPSGMYAGHHPG